MAFDRDTSSSFISGSTIYAYTEVEWRVGTDVCTYTHIGGVTSPFGGWGNTPQATLFWREWGGSAWGAWHDYASGSAGYSGPGDKALVEVEDSFVRMQADREVQLACDVYATSNTGSGTGSAWLTYIVPEAVPPSATTLSATRVSDTRINLSWPDGGGVKKNVRIERSVDGSSWGEVAVIKGSSTSWSDTTTSANHLYSYRFRYHNTKEYGGYSNAVSVATTPAAPSSMATAVLSGVDIEVALVNPSPVSSRVCWEASLDGMQSWTVSGESEDIAGFICRDLAGTVYIRVKNVYDGVTPALESDWLVSEQIITICAPNPPALNSPAGVLDMSQGKVVFDWTHDAPDKSAQTAAKLRYTVGGVSQIVNIAGSEQVYELEPIPWAMGTMVSWNVRTKGMADDGGPDDDGYSDWAAIDKQFTCRQVPNISFVAECPPDVIEALPIPISMNYSDPQGLACREAKAYLYEGSTLVHTEALAIGVDALTGEITAAELTPEDGSELTVKVVAVAKDSGLQAVVSKSFRASYTPPVLGVLDVANDPETGYVTLTASYDNEGEGAAAVKMDVYRVTDHKQPLALDAQPGIGIVDMYAPLNTDYTYEVVTYADSGSYAVNRIANNLHTTRWFAYWDGKIAWAKWSPEGSFSITRPEKRRVHYAGRKWALSYDSKAQEQSHSISWNTISKEDWENGFYQLMDEGGRGVYKGCDGWVFHADFDYSEKPSYTSLTSYSQVSLTITRIDGEEL